jgi:uncharacterized SAM-binding protein YcdF (DUF218 family)
MLLDYQKISSEPITSWEKDPSADCAVVLTGGAGRVREGLSLLSRNLVRKMIISGVHPDVDFDDLYSSWIFLGEVDEKDVLLEHRSTTTYGNAQQSLPIVEALGCRDIVLVTSQYHMARAFKTFVASFPPGFPIYRHTLAAGRSESNRVEIWTEVFKGIFYSLWAY